MDASRICVQAVCAGTENQIVAQSPKTFIPIARKPVRCDPPQKVEKMRARQLGDTVQGVSGWIEIVYMLAVNVKLELIGQMRQPFGDDSLAAVPFVQKRGNHRDTNLRLDWGHVTIPANESGELR